MNFAVPPEYLASYVNAQAVVPKTAPPANLQHRFEDPHQMQNWGPQGVAPVTTDAHTTYGTHADQPQEYLPQQYQQGGQPITAQNSNKLYKASAPPHSPQPQQYLPTAPSPQQSDTVICWDVQLAKLHEKSTFLDHPTIPRFLHSYVDQDMSRLPPSLQYIAPANRTTMRPTAQVLPNTSKLADTLQLPLGIIFQPFADTRPAEVDFSQLGGRLIRCCRCIAYINPFTTFCEGGRRWQCMLCRHMNETPNEYFCQLDQQTGLRLDLLQRPELTHCSVDIYPSREFLRNPPQRPAFILLLDCTYHAIASGNLRAICEGVLAALDTMKDEDAIYMGVIGFSSTVYFFNMASTLQSPRVIVAPDIVWDDCKVEDNFKVEPIELPSSVNELLVNVKDSYPLLKELFEKLPEMCSDTKDVGCAFGPAFAAALSMLGNSGGKILASIDTMPSIGSGKLSPRFNISKLSNQPKEYTVLTEANEWYKHRALACSNSNISVDIFAGSAQDLDLATIAPLARLTSGKIYRCTPVTLNGISRQVHRVLTRYTAFEALLRVRTSKGLTVPNFYGHCHVREPDLLALPIGDEDSSYTVELKPTHDLKGNYAYVQIAVVHTSRSRERRIRVHTFQLAISGSIGQVVNSADSLAVASFLSKMAIDSAIKNPFQKVQQRIMERLLTTIRAVKTHNESHGQRGGYFMMPDSLRFVPQLLHGFFRSAAIGFSTSTPILPDERMAAISQVVCTAPQGIVPFFIGWTFEVYSPYVPPEELPQPIFSSQSFFKPDGVYLLHIGTALVLWYGRTTDPAVLNVLGLPSNSGETQAPKGPPQSQGREPRYLITDEQLIEIRRRLDELLWKLSDITRCGFTVSLEICQQGSKTIEPVLTRMMMEDEVRSLPNYASFLRDVWQRSSLIAK
ncbi:protein transport protein Sec24A, putative [Trypanosoma brucei brucei TREU927]|uniref:Protein transport protein Sec24A, putative n=1 Tax=Trypanosoma brucei brucei (strain 927/4 GUTat10.1) TaxID=185431 RepID=Q580T3_TRYB2|nr:protein transport protein Sec24A, putative [Trypanosoma brucei brucei TREU927]AAX81051.1 protein transport protein Sec24A, putative [Trypanosoma brucei]AAZ10573.1 protein transport protein Sec24A, putative [Trypanosoma brucei brucei TREU927]